MRQHRFYLMKDQFIFSTGDNVQITLYDLCVNKSISLFKFTFSIHQVMIGFNKELFSDIERILKRNYE